MSESTDLFAQALLCSHCGYDLRGTDTNRCPECGNDVDREGLKHPRTPWANRKDIGSIKAYFMTVWGVIRRPSAIASDVHREMNYREARRFQAITVGLVCVWPVAVFVFLWFYEPEMTRLISRINGPASYLPAAGWQIDWVLPWSVSAVWLPVLPICFVLAMILITGVGSYFSHAKAISIDQQNRAIALSYYACAPWALVFLGGAMIAIIGLLLPKELIRRPEDLPYSWAIFLIAGVVMVDAAPFLTWFATLRICQKSTQRSFASMILPALLLPITWCLLLGVTMLFIPWCLGYFRLVFG